MALSETKICNAALGKIGSVRINDFDSDDTPEAIACRLHYEITRDSLIRSHFWRFASARASLSPDTVTPKFEYSRQFILPTDFLRLKSVFSNSGLVTRNITFSYAIEGQRLLTDDSDVNLRYIKKVTDVTKFDPLFVEVLILQLALKIIAQLAGGDPKMTQVLLTELSVLMPRVRTLDRQETNTRGRVDLDTWNNARTSLGGRIDSQLGS